MRRKAVRKDRLFLCLLTREKWEKAEMIKKTPKTGMTAERGSPGYKTLPASRDPSQPTFHDMKYSLEHKRSYVRDHWKKAVGFALLLMACEPGLIDPTETCENLPACSAIDYGIDIRQPASPAPDSTTGHILVQELGLSIGIVTRPVLSAQTLCPMPGRSGVAYALSCAPCAGPLLVVDSLYFTTDIRIASGDTLKAGFNFIVPKTASLPFGFSGSYGLTIQKDMGILFRDSVFQVRFAGTADTVRKSGFTTLRITNPALLYP